MVFAKNITTWQLLDNNCSGLRSNLALFSLDNLVCHKLRTPKLLEVHKTNRINHNPNIVTPPIHLLKENSCSWFLNLKRTNALNQTALIIGKRISHMPHNLSREASWAHPYYVIFNQTDWKSMGKYIFFMPVMLMHTFHYNVEISSNSTVIICSKFSTWG